MPGSSFLRRLRARGFGWRMAAGGFVLAAVAVIVVVLLTRSPTHEDEKRDPRAAKDLVALMRKGDAAQWLARYDFTRTLANGRSLTQPLTEARLNTRHVLVSGTAMTIERGDRVQECNLVGERSSCHASTRSGAVAASEVISVAVDAGAYDVTRRPSQTIAGLDAACFAVRAVGVPSLPDVGTETDACFSDAGVPLSQRVVRTTGDVDERVARSVRMGVDADAIDRLQRSFGSGGSMGAP